ncbi:MAG: chemotaxis protein CheX [Bryobacteraceae bacterium]
MQPITNEDLFAMVCGATQEVFATMLNLELQVGNGYVDNAAAVSTNGIVSFVGLAGAWAGTGSISCSASFACKISSQLMMSEYTAVDDDVLDALAEVTNMIIGNVKTALEERVGPMGLSIPTVIYGRNFTSRTLGKQEWAIVPFRYGNEHMEIQVCLSPQKEGMRPRPAFAGESTLQI